MILALLTAQALAAPAGFYHPTEVASASELYAKAADSAGGAYSDASSTAEAVAAALNAYEEALDLLGPAAPAAERERLAGLRTSYNREFAQLQKFTSYMMDDFEGVFVASMDRATASLGVELVECEAEIPLGPAMPGITQRYEPNPDCVGDDLNTKLAGIMDADPILRTEIDEILAIEWPTIAVDKTAQPIIGGGGRYVGTRPFMRQAAGASLSAIDRADEEARLPFEVAIEQGATTEERQALLTQAAAVTAQTAAARAAAAGPALEVASAVMSKWQSKGEPATGWCANPQLLGGCEGNDATMILLPRLLDEKKVQKALP